MKLRLTTKGIAYLAWANPRGEGGVTNEGYEAWLAGYDAGRQAGLAKRTPGPAPTAILTLRDTYPTHTNRFTNETTISIPASLWDRFVAEQLAKD